MGQDCLETGALNGIGKRFCLGWREGKRVVWDGVTDFDSNPTHFARDCDRCCELFARSSSHG